MEKKLIKITDIDGIKVGHAQDRENATGCTVIICEEGAVCGCDIRGGGPATRDTGLLLPGSAQRKRYAVMFSGGSAFGLDACGGAMAYLAEKGIGYKVGPFRVPLTVGASVFDLPVGSGFVYPDKKMGYEAAKNAHTGDVPEGNVGAGTGCIAGKFAGKDRAMKTGLGIYGVSYGKLKVAALAVVNAVGNVVDPVSGKFVAGIMGEDGRSVVSARDYLLNAALPDDSIENTTLCCIVTNAVLSKESANRVAVLTHNGYAKTISPVHTAKDGDAAFVMATGETEVSPDIVGIIAAECASEAILRAAKVEGAYGFKGHYDVFGGKK